MTDTNNFSESQLHAYVDNQLDEDERARVLDAISKNPELALRVSSIQRDLELLRLAYHHCPPPSRQHKNKLSINWVPSSIAAGIFLVIGVLSGLLMSNHETTINHKRSSPAISSIGQFNFANSERRKVLIHVSSKDKTQLKRALDKAENILRYSKDHKKPVTLTVVANASGLELLRKGSSFGERIKILASKYGNLKFKACGIAMENVRLKEGSIPKLLPEAIKVPNALDEILKKIKSGWVYLKT